MFQSSAHAKKRHAAEARFRWYGKIAIILAVSAIIFLLFSIIARGWQGFLHAEIRLTLTLDEQLIGNDSQNWRHADVAPAIKNALLATLPETTHDRKAMLELISMVSSGAGQEVRNEIIANPALIHHPFPLWLSASDTVERALKNHITLQTPETERRISNRQLGWLQYLQQNDAVRFRWNPYFFTSGDSREPELAGFMGSMIGSLFTLLVCMLIAFPVGVMAAIYLEEFARKSALTSLIELNINNLAAVPSIVYGLLGLSVYINVFGIPRSAPVTGGLTLAMMILPTIIIATRASLRAVPSSIRDAARGLGASPLQIVLHHTFPLAIPGIMTGTILGMARAMGETAPLLMIGMVAFIVDIPTSPVEPATAMPVQIYLWATSPQESFIEKTNAGIITLLIVLTSLNSLAIMLRKRYAHKW